MQYTKLGFSRLIKGFGPHQVSYSLIGNRSVTPALHIATVDSKRKTKTWT